MDVYQVWRYKTRWGADYRVGDKGVFHIPPPGRVMFMPKHQSREQIGRIHTS